MVPVPSTEACSFLTFALGWHTGSIPMYADGKAIGRARLHPLARLTKRVECLKTKAELTVGLDGPSTALWAWVKGTEQVRRAHRFRPAPSLVLRIGTSSERLLVWALDEVLPEQFAIIANKRIAYRLRTPYTRTTPDSLRVPLPGTFVRGARRKAVEVFTTRFEPEVGFSNEQITGRLREPPDPDGWKNR